MKKILLVISLILISVGFSEVQQEDNELVVSTAEAKIVLTEQLATVSEEVVEKHDDPTGFFQEEEEPELQSYVDSRLKCVLSAPVSWTMDTTSRNYKVLFYPEETIGDIYVGLITFVTQKVVTADGLYLRRAGSVWDGWHLLGVKQADEKANFLVGSSEKVSAIYSKSELMPDLRLDKTLVAEDIYIKDGKKIFMVTVRASKKKWDEYIKDIALIKKSFYIEDN